MEKPNAKLCFRSKNTYKVDHRARYCVNIIDAKLYTCKHVTETYFSKRHFVSSYH